MSNIGFIFSGQGSQYIGMGKSIYENFEESKNVFNKADEILGFSLTSLCFEGKKEELEKTENTQPAILTTSFAIYKVLESRGIKPKVMAGLSLGEYSALVASGALEFEKAIALVRKRGRFMEEAVPSGTGSMAAIIGLEKEKIDKIVQECSEEGFIAISNLNCPKQIVLGGEKKAIQKACIVAREKGALRALELSVSGPFHTPMLKGAAENLELELNKIEFTDPIVPVITNVTGDYMEFSKIRETLKTQVMSTVLWQKSIEKMLENGIDTFVEIGPGKVLSNFIKKINRKVNILNVEDTESLKTVLEKLKV